MFSVVSVAMRVAVLVCVRVPFGHWQVIAFSVLSFRHQHKAQILIGHYVKNHTTCKLVCVVCSSTSRTHTAICFHGLSERHTTDRHALKKCATSNIARKCNFMQENSKQFFSRFFLSVLLVCWCVRCWSFMCACACAFHTFTHTHKNGI